MRILLLLGCVLVATATPAERLLKEWQEYKLEFKKTYENPEEEKLRIKLFEECKKRVDEHNIKYKKGESSYYMAVNEYCDWFPEELNNMMGLSEEKIEKPPKRTEEEFKLPSPGSTPDGINWVEKGAVTKVTSQGPCGSCWAFGAIGSLEGHLFIKTKKLIDLSEQDLVDCSRPYGTKGCNGGYPGYAFDYIRVNGISSEKDYPYEAINKTCRRGNLPIVTKIKGYQGYVYEGNETMLLSDVLKGPVTVHLDLNPGFVDYGGGIFDDTSNEKVGLHAVVLVGYNKKSNPPYWILKNSWGTTWGEKGYMRMVMGKFIMKIGYTYSYPIL